MIKQSVINTFDRVGIPYKRLSNKSQDEMTTRNRFTGEEARVSELLAYLIQWVYETNNEYERCFETGKKPNVNLSDFDRIRHFVISENADAYMICLD